jgi:hypothetical protein
VILTDSFPAQEGYLACLSTPGTTRRRVTSLHHMVFTFAANPDEFPDEASPVIRPTGHVRPLAAGVWRYIMSAAVAKCGVAEADSRIVLSLVRLADENIPAGVAAEEIAGCCTVNSHRESDSQHRNQFVH